MNYSSYTISASAESLTFPFAYNPDVFYVVMVNGTFQMTSLSVSGQNLVLRFNLREGDFVEIFDIKTEADLSEYVYTENTVTEPMKERMAYLKSLLIHSPFLRNFSYG